MTAAALLADLAARGVRLERRGDAIRIIAPRGVLSDADKAALQTAKAGLLRLLPDHAAPPPPPDEPRLVACCCPRWRRRGEPPPQPCALHALLGETPDPAALAALDAEVRQAIAQYRVDVAYSTGGPGPLLVRGRPLSDWLDLDTIGRLITARVMRSPDDSNG